MTRPARWLSHLSRLLGAVVAVLVTGLALMSGCTGPTTTSTTQLQAVSTTTLPATTTPSQPATSFQAQSTSTTVASSGSTTSGAIPHGDTTGKISSGGRVRTFLVHVPRSYEGSKSVPLLISFHGHGGTGATQAKLTHMSSVADENGFIVVYPDGVDHAWNDGRPGINGADEGIDDSGFTRDLVHYLESRLSIDSHRIYATGFSNGGFMCYRVARDLPDLVAAVAPIAGLLSQELAGQFTSSTPISILIIAGTADPLIPFTGGEVAANLMAGRGVVYSAHETARFFVKLDECSSQGSTVSLPNTVRLDGATATRTTWTGGRHQTEVQLYTVLGGGHTWPGGLQYSPVRITGPTCRDFDASRVIWEFFSRHSLG